MLVDYSNRIIPRREPELIAREARRKWRGCADKVPTTSIDRMVVWGVVLESRYRDADEFEAMRSMVLALGGAAFVVKSIFCDSNCTHAYTVLIRDWAWETNLVGHITRTLEDAVFRARGGHNGIVVEAGDGAPFGSSERRIDVAATWVDL
jgi:hypothetical protein